MARQIPRTPNGHTCDKCLSTACAALSNSILKISKPTKTQYNPQHIVRHCTAKLNYPNALHTITYLLHNWITNQICTSRLLNRHRYLITFALFNLDVLFEAHKSKVAWTVVSFGTDQMRLPASHTLLPAPHILLPASDTLLPVSHTLLSTQWKLLKIWQIVHICACHAIWTLVLVCRGIGIVGRVTIILARLSLWTWTNSGPNIASIYIQEEIPKQMTFSCKRNPKIYCSTYPILKVGRALSVLNRSCAINK